MVFAFVRHLVSSLDGACIEPISSLHALRSLRPTSSPMATSPLVGVQTSEDEDDLVAGGASRTPW